MRTFADDSLLRWEVYPSGADHGHSDKPYIIFNCLTLPQLPARVVEWQGGEADAERAIVKASDAELKDIFATSREIN